MQRMRRLIATVGIGHKAHRDLGKITSVQRLREALSAIFRTPQQLAGTWFAHIIIKNPPTIGVRNGRTFTSSVESSMRSKGDNIYLS